MEQQQENGTGLVDMIRQRIGRIRTWITPNPADPPVLRVLHLAWKSIVLLLLLALSVVLSPVVLLVLLIAFMAAL